MTPTASPYLLTCLDRLRAIVSYRLAQAFQPEASEPEAPAIPLPAAEDLSPFAQFVRHYQPSPEERLLILTALAPQLLPGFFDRVISSVLPQGGDFPEFGGVRGQQHRGTLATAETALFLLAGTDLSRRLAYLPLFDADHYLFKHNILRLESVPNGDPPLSGRLLVEPEFAEVFITGKLALPKLSIHFPAQHLATELEWDDLVLNDHTHRQIRELETWVRHNDHLLHEWGMYRRIKPGYRALFYGPPGTGKTLTATLLGKYTGRPVFRIDLSMVVSKFIGETEKNLASLFDKAENKDWILFFDEADAIFSKRTGVRDAHDKYANQEVSYLLQRIENHPGLTILASNFKNNIDEAFIRRFNAVIYFPPPQAEERRLLWQKAFPQPVRLAPEISLSEIAQGYELTGSHIINIVQFVCLESLGRQSSEVSREDLLLGIRRELAKEGKGG